MNANVHKRSAGEMSGDIRKALDSIAFPPGYRYQFGGSTKNMAESFSYAISGAAAMAIGVHLHDSGQPVQELRAALA